MIEKKKNRKKNDHTRDRKRSEKKWVAFDRRTVVQKVVVEPSYANILLGG
jgi:hypothetical protein